MHEIPNDYIIVDPDTSTIRVPVASQLSVTSVFLLAGTEPGKTRAVPITRLVDFLANAHNWSTPFHLHFNARGQIDEVVEQYRP